MLSALPANCPDEPHPLFRNARSELVRPTRFAVIYWDGFGDTLYAFEDPAVFERQRSAAERQGAPVVTLTAAQAADWIRRGGKAALYEASAGAAAMFGNLRLG